MTGIEAPDLLMRIKLYVPILMPGLAKMSWEKLLSNVLKNADPSRARGHRLDTKTRQNEIDNY